MKLFKNILSGLILLVMTLPLLQQKFKFINLKPLSGAYTLPDTTKLTLNSWASGVFQEKYGPWYEYQIGFRPFFVRLRNQLNYSLFHSSTNYVTVGKENQLFAWNYWSPFQGLDYIGRDSIAERVHSLVQLQNELDKDSIPLLIVIGANKVRYIPEFLPDNYEKEEQFPNNYRDYLKALENTNLKVIDFNEIFLKMKKEKGEKMFPNTGTHWSAYGMGMCLDSIISYAVRQNSDALKSIISTQSYTGDSIVDSDIDLSNDLNIFYDIPREANLFPRFNIDQQGRKVKLFVIGDSFYWNLYQLDAFYEVVDSTSHYWYYNNTNIAFNGGKTNVDEMNVVEIAKKSDLVVILATEANLRLFPFGFPEDYTTAISKKIAN